jgi:hypothetical protein
VYRWAGCRVLGKNMSARNVSTGLKLQTYFGIYLSDKFATHSSLVDWKQLCYDDRNQCSLDCLYIRVEWLNFKLCVFEAVF